MKKFRVDRASIFASNDIETRDVHVPEWGGEGAYVTVSSGSGEARDNYEADIHVDVEVDGKKIKEIDRKRIRLALVRYATVDENGAPLFSESDIEQLKKKNSKPINRIFAVAQELWGIGNDEVKELEKN